MAKYIWPVPAGTGINQLFGTNPGGFNPWGGHTGTDFGTYMHTPLRAIADGVVLHADWFRGAYWDNPWLIEPGFAGIGVVIDHGECLSVYAHMNDTPLNVGQRVKQGDFIGRSGNTRSEAGEVFGPHLHFEIMPDGWNNGNGTYGRVDPARYCSEFWGVTNETSVKPQNTGTVTPILEDTLSAAEVTTILDAISDKTQEVKQYIADHMLHGTVSGGDWRPGATKIAIENQRRINAANAKLAALETVVGQLAKGQGVTIDYKKIDASIKAALADGIELTGSITAKVAS